MRIYLEVVFISPEHIPRYVVPNTTTPSNPTNHNPHINPCHRTKQTTIPNRQVTKNKHQQDKRSATSD